MARTSKHNLYTGRSGQLAVMSVFLNRGYNVAIPEVDVGDDIFVVRDADGDLSRVQVKSAIGKGSGRHYGDYQVPLSQLQRQHRPELFYVFTMHYEEAWKELLVIERPVLEELWEQGGLGRANRAGTRVKVRLSFGATDVTSDEFDLQAYRHDWSHWPPIEH